MTASLEWHTGQTLRIALLDRDRKQIALLQKWLQEASFSCKTYSHAKTFLHELSRESFDLIITDGQLTDGPAIDMLKIIRSIYNLTLPVIFVSLRNREDDIVHALESGADDYLVRPLRQRETLARIKASSRRCHINTDSRHPLTLGPYQIDSHNQVISNNGTSVELTEKEFKLAILLFQNINHALSRSHLLQSVWNLDEPVPTRTLDTHISSLRIKLNTIRASDLRLRSIYRYGYRLEQTGVRRPQRQPRAAADNDRLRAEH